MDHFKKQAENYLSEAVDLK